MLFFFLHSLITKTLKDKKRLYFVVLLTIKKRSTAFNTINCGINWLKLVLMENCLLLLDLYIVTLKFMWKLMVNISNIFLYNQVLCNSILCSLYIFCIYFLIYHFTYIFCVYFIFIEYYFNKVMFYSWQFFFVDKLFCVHV